MKNINTIFKKAHLIMIVCLFKATISFAQPVIKVPPTCEVVYAGTGTGASTGFGGAVGDGGIVAMPDPFDFTTNEGDFNYVANNTELIEWSLLGDISMQTETSNNEVLQPTGAINPINLQSYNKNLRVAENPSVSQPQLNSNWGRSKGRVIVSYYNKPCKASIKFEILKRYKQNPDKKNPSVVPPIFGPDCVLPNTTYTYSVDPTASDNANDEIGFDKYYWSGLPEGGLNVYSSADNSSVTFTTASSVSNFTIQCCYGRANAWDGDAGAPIHTTCISKLVGGQPAAPVFTTRPPSCLDTGLTSFSVTINPAFIAADTTYTWSAPGTSWTLVPAGTPSGQTLTVSGIDNNPGTLLLTIAIGSCLPVVVAYPVNRNYINPFVITGATCGTGGNTYGDSLPSNGLLNPTTWTSPAGWMITPTNGTASTVNITIPNTAVAGAYILTAKSNSCAGTTSLTVNVRPVTPVFTAGTPHCVIKGTSSVITIAVTPIAGITNYSWTYPAGVTCTNCTTANPTFVLNSAGTSVTITATALGADSCNSAAVSKTINYIAVATNLPGGGFNDQYAVNGSCGAVTSWFIGTMLPTPATTTYTFSSGNITITNSGGGTSNVLTISGSGGAQITSVCANLASGIQVCATSFGSNTQRQSGTALNTTPKEVIKNVIISPNPNSGNFNIKVTDYNESASATLADFSGNEFKTYQLRKGDNPIQNEGLKKGTYFVVLRIDGKQETRQISIK